MLSITHVKFICWNYIFSWNFILYCIYFIYSKSIYFFYWNSIWTFVTT